MARIVRVLALAVAVATVFAGTPKKASAAGPVNAATVAEHMDKSKYSSSEIKTYLKGIKGAEVAAEGRINDILTGKTGNRVVVFVSVPGREKNFVVDVFVDDASKLQKNNHVSCTGKYVKYNMFTVNGITLKDGSCAKK